MNLSVSNIAWDERDDEIILARMQELGYKGLEIAPTRIISDAPYDHTDEAAEWKRKIKEKYGFEISSMQSIWFGRTERLFGSQAERSALLHYTKKAVDFAATVGCGNLVFGCPKNRNLPKGTDPGSAEEFFRAAGEYAKKHGTVISMEANPAIYNTNYINNTLSAIELVEKVNCEGFRLNLDIGTMICNDENPEDIVPYVNLINHVHISEPHLRPIEHREIHKRLFTILKSSGYERFISIEMGRQPDNDRLIDAMIYLKEIVN